MTPGTILLGQDPRDPAVPRVLLVAGPRGGGTGAWRGARVPEGIEETLRRYKVTTVYEPVWEYFNI